MMPSTGKQSNPHGQSLRINSVRGARTVLRYRDLACSEMNRSLTSQLYAPLPPHRGSFLMSDQVVVSGGSSRHASYSCGSAEPSISSRPRGLQSAHCGSSLSNVTENIPFSCDSPRVRGKPDMPASPLQDYPQPEVDFSFEGSDGNLVNDRPLGLEFFLADEMPHGRCILLNLLTTWGDINEVGLSGIEIFDEKGERIIPTKLLDSAGTNTDEQEAETIRVEGGFTSLSYKVPNEKLFIIVEHPTPPETLSELDVPITSHSAAGLTSYETCIKSTSKLENIDPRRRVANLINDINNTHDETRLFTMPYSADHHHLIGFILPSPVTVSMVRIHNYGGCGRVHTNKGVRLLEITIDDKLVFRGEIAQNSGDVIPLRQVGIANCENILFTENKNVLQRVFTNAANIRLEAAAKAPKAAYQEPTQLSSTPAAKAHRTLCQSTTLFVSSGCANDAKRFGCEQAVLCKAGPPNKPQAQSSATTSLISGSNDATPPGCPKDVTSVCLMLLGTWGDTEKIGLSGLRLRDTHGCLVNQYISSWHVRFPLPDAGPDAGIDGENDAWTDQLTYLFDENAETAMTLPCVRGVEIIFIFAAPLPTLGLLEVANYSKGEHTFCGVKEARLFLSSASCSTGKDAQQSPDSLVEAYAALWGPDGPQRRQALSKHGIYEVTPEEGVSLRKAPAFLTIPRFQVYDLSLGSGPTVGGVPGGSAIRCPLSQSLTASMTIRAEMSMRRARMALKQRPKWLLEYQPYLTPLLPVAYVLKLNLIICARGVDELKAYAKQWMLNPLRACTFADENGDRIGGRDWSGRTRGVGVREQSSERTPKKSEDGSTTLSGEYRGCLQTECLFTVMPNDIQQDVETAAVAAREGIHTSLVKASLSLVYVADTPFCVSVLSLNRPLVMEGRVAWIKQIRVLMDDTLVFDSGDGGMPRPVPTPAPDNVPVVAIASGGEDVLSTVGSCSGEFTASAAGATSALGDVSLSNLPSSTLDLSTHMKDQLPTAVRYRTRLKPYVFFTLDTAVMEEARVEAARATV